MGWEWRCFVPCPTELELPETSGAEEEVRTDRYLLVASSAVGIKLRGGGGLEVKARKEEKQRGAQKWKKALVDKQGDPEEAALEQADLHSASAVAAAEDTPGGGASAELAEAHRTSNCHWVSVQKRRQQAWLPDGTCGEQTMLALQLHQSYASGAAAVGEAIHYRTFAFEGAPPPSLYGGVERWRGVSSRGDKAGWLDAIRDKLGPGSVVGGYPELLCTAFGHILQPGAEGTAAAASITPVQRTEPQPELPR